MKLSQLIHAMDKDETVFISDYDKPVFESTLYNGIVRGIHKDNPINKMHVQSITVCDDVLCVLVRKQRERN